MTNPEELQRRFSAPTRRFWVVVVGLAILLVVLGALAARPAWRGLKRWRASQFVSLAEKEFSRGNVGLAWDRARSAFQLDPNNADTLRLNARVLTAIGSEGGLMLWRRLLESSASNADDRCSYLEAALAFDRPELTELLVSNAPIVGGSARFQRIGALYHVGARRLDEALPFAREACRLEPSNATNTAMLATLLAVSPRKAERNEARELFRGLGQESGPYQLMAFQQLVQSGLGDRSDREWIAGYLSALSHPTPAQEVLLAETRMALDPTLIAATVSNLMASIPHQDLERLSLVVEALNRQQRYAEILQLTPPERSLRTRSLFLARFNALLALNRTEDAYRHLLLPNAPLPPWDLGVAKVQASQGSRERTRLEAHLQELLRAARNSPKRVRIVAELAEGVGNENVAEAAWKQLGSDPSFATASLRGLQRQADRRGDTWAARDYARQALRVGSADPALKTEVAYYDLLLAENLERAFAEAEHEFAARPDDFFSRITVALGYLRLGMPDKARDLLDRVIVERGALRADALAVLTATYGANGLSVRAQETASITPLNLLRPEERELVRPWLGPRVPVSSRSSTDSVPKL